jgi:Zn-finger nucleic acid-binding protein
MARCKSCSAPLRANTNLCRYCGVRNDVDLHGKHAFSLHSQQSERICPQCDKPLQTIDLNLNGPFLIERCTHCFGLFFDPGEIDTLLESSVSGVFDVNHELLQNINRDRYQHKEVKYVKCPVCRILMNRMNFGQRSGVIIDQCRTHGIWLESGEITHLMEWKKAGGEILHKHRTNHKKPAKHTSTKKQTVDYDAIFGNKHDSEPDVLELVSGLVFKLFK